MEQSTSLNRGGGERFLCKAEWGYKPDTFLSCPEGTKAYSYVVTESSDVGLALVRVKGVSKAPEEALGNPEFEKAFPRILRQATEEDLKTYRRNQEKEKEMARFSQDEADVLNMDMDILQVVLSLDGRRVLVIYTAPARVDFRQFLKIFGARYHVRLEMRQIGARDKARIVGGIGVCGLPLCCKTFLTQFNGVTIAMAKNQLLSLNVPKLSGQCGKLMCCLGYENDYYRTLRPLFPKVGDAISFNGKKWVVTGINIIADTITVTDGDSYDTYSNANWKRLIDGKAPVDISSGEDDPVVKKVLQTVSESRCEGPTVVSDRADGGAEKKSDE